MKNSSLQASASSVSERTYQTLLDNIVSRRISPGEVLEERKIADELQVSRTPLRAALNRLLGEGIVARLSNGSVIVKNFGATELLELLHIRLLLESEAAALASGRIPAETLAPIKAHLQAILENSAVTAEQDWAADNLVHDVVASHCGNKTLAGLIHDARLKARLCNVERLPGRSTQARLEHLAIIDSLSSGDAEQARQAMAKHLNAVRNAFMKTLGYLHP